MRVGPTFATGRQGWDKLIGRAVAGFPSHRPGKQEEKAAKPPRSSLPSFIRRTLIFSLMSVSCRSGQKQSSAGAITTSRGIPQNALCFTHTQIVLVPPLFFLGMERALATQKKKNGQNPTSKTSPKSECNNPKVDKNSSWCSSPLVKSLVSVSRPSESKTQYDKKN